MRKQLEQRTKGVWWKVLIVLTFIISLVSLSMVVYNELPNYEYYTRIITLENTNTIEYFDGRIVDYLCDEGVYANTHGSDSIYFSTWEGTDEVKLKYKGMTGSCMIKVRRRI